MVPQIAEAKAEEPRYSFTLRDANVQEILFSLAKQTPYNIVVDRDVTGTVTVDLKEVTLMEALDLITDMLNLT
ncbi:MAG: pilus (MSHA type) biogenesis protein MshL, partial [Deltaproteobacteria bacterium]|nr:pilus (MSHA type) biogenesis protein MshL [Deltaproteobacteria bacterium]